MTKDMKKTNLEQLLMKEKERKRMIQEKEPSNISST